jgi:hypothetical protein
MNFIIKFGPSEKFKQYIVYSLVQIECVNHCQFYNLFWSRARNCLSLCPNGPLASKRTLLLGQGKEPVVLGQLEGVGWTVFTGLLWLLVSAPSPRPSLAIQLKVRTQAPR